MRTNAKDVYIKNLVKIVAMLIIVCFAHNALGNVHQYSRLKTLSNSLHLSLRSMHEELDDLDDFDEENLSVSQDEKVLQEIYAVGNLVYQKLIELFVIYYCTELEVLYDQSLLEISKQVVHLLQLVLKYIPLVLNNKKISNFEKIRKVSYAGSLVIASGLWIHAFWVYQKEKYAH